MERAVFADRLRRAAAQTRELARTMVEEPLPEATRFRVRRASPAATTEHLDIEPVVDLLWRDGHVPASIDLMVAGASAEHTVLELYPAVHVTDDDTLLMYAASGVAPFGVKAPMPPPDREAGDEADDRDGRRFSIHHHSGCWSLADLDLAARHAEKVASLALYGSAFADAALAALPRFPAVETLDVVAAPLVGPGLVGLASLPRLYTLRLGLAPVPDDGAPRSLDLGALPALPHLGALSLTSPPARVTGVAALAAAVPAVTFLDLTGDDAVAADATLALPAVRDLWLALPTVPAWVAFPPTLRNLFLHARDATDDDVERAVAACPDSLQILSLRGAPVTDRILPALARFPRVFLDAHGTRISAAALAELAAAHPGFRSHAQPAPRRR